MKYVMMTLEEARKFAKEDAVVLISVMDLESDDCNVGFTKKTFGECDSIMKSAETIARVCDDIVNQIRVFSVKQSDAINYEPKGSLSTILIKEDCLAKIIRI